MHEGLILATNLNIVKRLPGQDKVAGFEEGPCAVAMHDFVARESVELCRVVVCCELCGRLVYMYMYVVNSETECSFCMYMCMH